MQNQLGTILAVGLVVLAGAGLMAFSDSQPRPTQPTQAGVSGEEALRQAQLNLFYEQESHQIAAWTSREAVQKHLGDHVEAEFPAEESSNWYVAGLGGDRYEVESYVQHIGPNGESQRRGFLAVVKVNAPDAEVEALKIQDLTIGSTAGPVKVSDSTL